MFSKDQPTVFKQGYITIHNVRIYTFQRKLESNYVNIWSSLFYWCTAV